MKRFVVPPGWPVPPRRNWTPPRTWRPDPVWPPAPAGWSFWVDAQGEPVRGPVGRYGGPRRRAVVAGVAAPLVLLVAGLVGLSSLGVLGDDSPAPQAVPLTEDRDPSPRPTSPRPTTPGPTRTPSPPAGPTTKPKPTAVPSSPPAVRRPSAPATTRSSRRAERPDRPAPTTTSPRPSPTRPRTTPSRPPTDEEILREYCRRQGLDPAWCDPDNWPRNRSR